MNRELEEAQFDAARWKAVALHLAECHAASLESAPKSMSQRERRRLQSICNWAINHLSGGGYDRGTLRRATERADLILARLREAASKP